MPDQPQAAGLKPCPWCGAIPEVVDRDVEPQGDPWYGKKEETFVLCNCGACLFDGTFHEGFADEASAIAAWNRRSGAPRRRPISISRIKEMARILDLPLGRHFTRIVRATEEAHGIAPPSQGKE